jgi:hypothetical protein
MGAFPQDIILVFGQWSFRISSPSPSPREQGSSDSQTAFTVGGLLLAQDLPYEAGGLGSAQDIGNRSEEGKQFRFIACFASQSPERHAGSICCSNLSDTGSGPSEQEVPRPPKDKKQMLPA